MSAHGPGDTMTRPTRTLLPYQLSWRDQYLVVEAENVVEMIALAEAASSDLQAMKKAGGVPTFARAATKDGMDLPTPQPDSGRASR